MAGSRTSNKSLSWESGHDPLVPVPAPVPEPSQGGDITLVQGSPWPMLSREKKGGDSVPHRKLQVPKDGI